MNNKILEFFGESTRQNHSWEEILKNQFCPFTQSKCFKVRKSTPEISIGTCTVRYGRDSKDVLICPHRLLEKKRVFADCVHLLTLHEPGNELHIVSEISIPGGSVDYFLISARKGKVKDFVAIEFQTLDTTGTLWPERQRLIKEVTNLNNVEGADSKKTFGMNWKMTAKTILVQLHHKIETLEHFNKHLVLVIQDHLFNYMDSEFNFNHLSNPALLGDSMHIHSYQLNEGNKIFELDLINRVSTDAEGMAKCLGLQAEAKVELKQIITVLEKKISSHTLFSLI